MKRWLMKYAYRRWHLATAFNKDFVLLIIKLPHALLHCLGATQIQCENSRKRLAVRIPAVKSPLYLTENLSSGQLPPMLGVGLSAFCLQKKKKNSV